MPSALHLVITYSPIYDQMLTELAGQSFTSRQENAGYRFETRVRRLWKKYDAKLFRYYKKNGLAFPASWPIYVAHKHARLDPFSDPTTILIEKDMDDVLATIVHEFGHLLLKQPANERRMAGIWRHLDSTFKKEKIPVRVHMAVALLARSALRALLGRARAEKILLPERRFYGLKRAWHLVDRQGDLDWDRPLKAMKQLKNVPTKGF